MMNLLEKILSVGGLIPRGKTYTGLLMMLFSLLSHYKPEYLPLIIQLATVLGVPLTTIGVAHKAVKKELDK